MEESASSGDVRLGLVQVVALIAAVPVAFALTPYWPGCHALDSWPAHLGALWLALAVLVTLACALVHAPSRLRSLRRLLISCAAMLVLALFVDNLGVIGSLDRGAQKRTLGDIRTVATAIDAYRAEHGVLPRVTSVAGVVAFTGVELELVDGWGAPLAVEVDATGYCIVSYGLCGELDLPAPQGTTIRVRYPGERATDTWRSDIVLCDGTFVRFPEGSQ